MHSKSPKIIFIRIVLILKMLCHTYLCANSVASVFGGGITKQTLGITDSLPLFVTTFQRKKHLQLKIINALR